MNTRTTDTPMPADDVTAHNRLTAAAPAMLAELIRCETDLECLYNIALESGARPNGNFPPHKRVREVIDLAVAPA